MVKKRHRFQLYDQSLSNPHFLISSLIFLLSYLLSPQSSDSVTTLFQPSLYFSSHLQYHLCLLSKGNASLSSSSLSYHFEHFIMYLLFLRVQICLFFSFFHFNDLFGFTMKKYQDNACPNGRMSLGVTARLFHCCQRSQV